MGIEPTLPAWKAEVLPLNHTRSFNSESYFSTSYAVRQYLFKKKSNLKGGARSGRLPCYPLYQSGFTCLFGFIFPAGKHSVCQDSENKRTSDRCDVHTAEGNCQTADTRDQDDRCGKQITVVVEVDRLEHFKTGHSDETVERDAYAAHDAAGYR